jgi:adenylyltransferase/sulfurtransferase
MYRGTVPEEKFPVIGVAPAVIGSIQATEVIKYLLGIGQLLTNRLLLYDGLEALFTEFVVNRNPECDHCGSPIVLPSPQQRERAGVREKG